MGGVGGGADTVPTLVVRKKLAMESVSIRINTGPLYTGWRIPSIAKEHLP